MQKPKLLFVFEHKHPEWLVADGLWSALDVLENDFEIAKYNLSDKDVIFEWDIGQSFILGWGAFGSKVDEYIRKNTGYKTGLCVAGNATQVRGAEKYDVLFYETDWIDKLYLPVHPNKVKAFGVNTDIWSKPEIATPIVWDYIGVGAFASWKRWEKMTEKKGTKLVVGEYQEGNEEESLGMIRNLVRNGVMVAPQASPFDLMNYYSYSRTLYIPANLFGGGERAILEAKAMGLNIEIENDNPKLKELADLPVVPSHIDYAEILKTNILKLL